MDIDTVLLADISYAVDFDGLAASLRIEPGGENADELAGLLSTAPPPDPAACHAAVTVKFADDRDDAFTLGGVAFRGALPRRLLADATTVYPYLATCGRALYGWARSMTDPLHRFWGDAYAQQALDAAIAALREDFSRRRYDGPTGILNPGSLPEWPLEQQGPLFELLAEPARVVGIGLDASFMMTPAKSVSGVFFPDENAHVNCRLCPRARCPRRSAEFEC